jgi:hypothetical protein
MSIVEPLDFSLPDVADEIVSNSRTNVRISSNAQSHSYNTNNIIRFQISGQSWVDLSSISAYATITESPTSCTLVAGTTTVPRKPTTAQYFSQMRILAGDGTIIEDDRDVASYHTIMTRLSGDCDYLDTTANLLWNGHSAPTSRQDLTNGKKLKLAVLDASGFLHSGKFIYLPSLGGSITIELTCASDANVYAVRDAADGVTYAMTNCECRFDTVQVSNEFQQVFNQAFNRGFAMSYQNYSLQTNQATALTNANLQLHKKASRVRDIISVVRASAVFGAKQADMFDFQGCSALSYSYLLSSKRYPPHPIDNHAMAYENVLKAIRSHKDSRHSPCIDINSWEDATDKSGDVPADDAATVYLGSFCMAVELEQVDGDFYSGVEVGGNGDAFEVSLTGLPNESHQIDTFMHHTRILSVSSSGIALYD